MNQVLIEEIQLNYLAKELYYLPINVYLNA